MAWIWTTILAFAIVVLLSQIFKNKNKKRLPPGPRALPIIGHLHLFGKRPHHDLHKLAKKHGPIMYMKLGFVPTIIVSSPQAAEQFLKTHDLVFAGRPHSEAFKYLAYDQRNMVHAPYGPYWRNMRKLFTLELLSNLRMNSFTPMRKEELGLFVESLKLASQDRVVVDLSSKISSLSADMTCRMVFGKKYSDEDLSGERGFKALIEDIMELAAIPNLGDFFPYVGKLDIQGLTRRLKAISKVFDAFFEKIIDEHEQRPKNSTQTKDMVDTMLEIMKSGEVEFTFDRRHIKGIMLDVLAASMDTSASVIEWTMSELLRNPQILKKVQKEIEEVVGMDRMVEQSDLDSLKYLEMVVKETFRLHPPGPLLLPHEAMEDCTIDGFHIPNKSRLLVNVYTIGRDPDVWTDPETFIPERFVGSNIDVRGRDFELIPFGSGRRSCPGKELGLITVRLVLAQMVHCFDWTLAYDMMPGDLDMTAHFGFVMSREKHLMVVPSYRLPSHT